MASTASAKKAILDALEIFEQENYLLKDANEKLKDDIEHLRLENKMLRQELEQAHGEKQSFEAMTKHLTEDVENLQRDLSQKGVNLDEERKVVKELQNKLQVETEKFNQQIGNMRKQFSQRESEFQRVQTELVNLQGKLDQKTERKNYSDNNLELLHEIQLLKAERKELANGKEESELSKKDLKSECDNLKLRVEAKDVELRNEKRRHSVLTKEFNSLLSENSSLKMRLKRGGTMFGSSQNLTSPSDESISSERTFDINATRPLLQSAKRRQGKRDDSDKDLSIIINNAVYQPTRATSSLQGSARESSQLGVGKPAAITRESTFTRRSGSTVSFRDVSKRSGSGSHAGQKSAGSDVTGTDDGNSTVAPLPSLRRH